MDQVRPLTSLSQDELIARIEQYMVVVELRDAEIRELHAANSALLAERGALAEAVDCLHAFAGRVAPSASFWDDTWPKLDAAIARAALAQGESC